MSEPGLFPQTRWTLIERLKSPDEAIARLALDELCAQYHYPLYCYIRRRGFDHHDAQDALHDFLAKLLRLDAFADADPRRGRLRTYLATALQRFLINWRRDRPEPGEPLESFDADEERYRREQFTDEETPERAFERKWGHELLGRVMRRLREDYVRRDHAALFDALRPILLSGATLRGEDTPRLATSLGLSPWRCARPSPVCSPTIATRWSTRFSRPSPRARRSRTRSVTCSACSERADEKISVTLGEGLGIAGCEHDFSPRTNLGCRPKPGRARPVADRAWPLSRRARRRLGRG